ncbi:uncharacterized protein LOC142783830 isoform X3 [Rhipicephalus microplus]|uniref:uncharacterized protein LOC142783830 isoform X3 n=1 Tax=Rhipicephalus microplus TaxID=6941 RepID=UPI003F6D8F86
MEDDARPTIMPPRKVPHALRAPLKQELARMVSQGIICKMEEPSDWLCLERGFTILDSLVDSWPGFLSRDGVHPSRLGNKVLADFLYREACALSTQLERRHIQQSYKESKASAWSGWARQEHFSINLEVDFPALGMHAVQYSPAVGGPSAAPAPVWKTSRALMQRHDTDQLASTIHGIGFTLVGGVRVRCKGSKAWWTWDSLPSPIFHGTSVPCKGNTGERPIQPMIPSRGASTTCDRKIRRASQEHESALVRSSVGEEEASAGKAAVPQAVGQCGDSGWKPWCSQRRAGGRLRHCTSKNRALNCVQTVKAKFLL